MRIAMIGTGYVGLVSGACFADFGHHVTCVDKDRGQDRRRSSKGSMPIWEPGLEALVTANVERGRLRVHDRPGDGIEGRGGGVHRGRHARRGAATAMPT